MLQEFGYRSFDGLLAEHCLRAPLPVKCPCVANVWEMPAPRRIGPVRIVRCWHFEGWTDALGRVEIPLEAAITVVQTPTIMSADGATGASKAFASNVTAGNAIFLSVAGYNDVGAGALPTTISDTRSNTYTVDASHVGTFLSFRADFIASTPNTTAGANTVSISYGAGASYYIRGVITEVSGLATSSILDATHKTDATTTGPTDSVTTLTTNTFVLGHMGSSVTNNRTVTATTGTELGQAHNGSAEPVFSAQYLIASSTGSKTHSWTISGTAAHWGVLLCAYKAAGGAAYTLTATGTSYSWTPQTAALKRASNISAGAGSYAWTGQDAALRQGFAVAAGAASYDWAGQVAGLLGAFNISAGAGSYAWAGQDVTLSASIAYAVTAGSAGWVWTGETVTLTHDVNLAPGNRYWVKVKQRPSGMWKLTEIIFLSVQDGYWAIKMNINGRWEDRVLFFPGTP